jgi:omega-6 fatty acid desaturase (delta-12 desaturase)
MSKEEYDALSPIGRAFERMSRTFLGVTLGNMRWGFRTLTCPTPTVRARLSNRIDFELERAALSAFFLARLGMVVVCQRVVKGQWELPVAGLMAAMVFPCLLVNWWIGLMALLHHSHPCVRWYADADEWHRAQAGPMCAVHVVAPRWLDWLLGHALDHTAHHVAPRTSSADLADAQRHLEEAFPELIVRVSLFECRRILAVCKLYDYENHRWLDYDGKPTTEPEA